MDLFDLTGETMRFAVLDLSSRNAAATTTETDTAGEMKHYPHLSPPQADLVVYLRSMRASFEELTVPRKYNILRDPHERVEVMQNSVEKFERAAYGILCEGVRGPVVGPPIYRLSLN